MTIDDLIQELLYVKSDVGEDSQIESIHKGGNFIQIKFTNGAITQLMEPSE